MRCQLGRLDLRFSRRIASCFVRVSRGWMPGLSGIGESRAPYMNFPSFPIRSLVEVRQSDRSSFRPSMRAPRLGCSAAPDECSATVGMSIEGLL